MKRFLKNNKGFTLVEMMIVLVIISLLVMLVIPNAANVLGVAGDITEEAQGDACDSLREMARMDPRLAGELPKGCAP